jgi:hypothetical protein
MVDMTPLKLSGICASVSVLSYAWALLRGDLICAGEFTACLIGAFFLFGLGAIVFLILGLVRRRHKPASI